MLEPGNVQARFLLGVAALKLDPPSVVAYGDRFWKRGFEIGVLE
jgi:hypothetical protein